MYADRTARHFRARLADRQLRVALALTMVLSGTVPPRLHAQQFASFEQPASVVRNITGPSETLEITANSSRILTLDKKIPRVMVSNPELLAVTPLSANQVQISAKKPGVTQVNLWDEDGQIHTVDVYVYGDVKELEHAYRTQFPHSAIKVYRYSGSLVLAGFIDRPDHVGPIMRMAEDYAPKVINNMQVGGVQQVLLKVKIYEVSRTKLRALGVDFGVFGDTVGFATNIPNILDGGPTVEIVGDDFDVLLEALQENKIAKIMADPNIVAISGRPAKFNSGGRAPYIASSGLNGIQIDWEEFGTMVDFVPIVLGNGNIRLEVRPSITNIDPTLSINLGQLNDSGVGGQIPGFTERMVDTAVEMKAGQTLALAGLIQRRTEAVNRGLPILADLPVLGIPFRKVKEEVNEIELLIMVTPEFIDPIDAPYCLPGMSSMSPDNCELYVDGFVEVPNVCNDCGPAGGLGACVPTHGHEPCCPGDPWGGGYGACQGCQGGPYYSPTQQLPYGGSVAPSSGTYGEPTYGEPAYREPTYGEPVPAGEPTHGELVLPPAPHGAALPRGGQQGPRTAMRPAARAQQPARSPQFMRNSSKPFSSTWGKQSRPQATATDSLIGPVGYDAD